MSSPVGAEHLRCRPGRRRCWAHAASPSSGQGQSPARTTSVPRPATLPAVCGTPYAGYRGERRTNSGSAFCVRDTEFSSGVLSRCVLRRTRLLTEDGGESTTAARSGHVADSGEYGSWSRAGRGGAAWRDALQGGDPRSTIRSPGIRAPDEPCSTAPVSNPEYRGHPRLVLRTTRSRRRGRRWRRSGSGAWLEAWPCGRHRRYGVVPSETSVAAPVSGAATDVTSPPPTNVPAPRAQCARGKPCRNPANP